jgi:SAM-dependent methyltransferase
MNDAISQDQIAAAKAYEALFVPALFGQWATQVADTAQLQSGQRVLDVACGTGVLSREVLARVGSEGTVAGLDANPGMLATAREITPGVDWTQGVAESLPYPDNSFDTVISQFGLMFFTDRSQAIAEMRRVLVPGGRLVVAVWDCLDNIPAYAALVALLERQAGTAAADALRAPFVLGHRQLLANVFVDGGVTPTDITAYPGVAQFPSLSAMVDAELRGWLPIMGVVLAERQMARMLQQAQTVLGPYVTAEGRLVFAMPALLVSAVKN